MTEEKDIRLSLINWYEGIISISNRVTSGNLSHQIPSLKCYLSSIIHLIKKNYPDNELGLKHSNMLSNLSEKCDRITTGNVTHEIALIKGFAINYISIFKDLIEYDNKRKT